MPNENDLSAHQAQFGWQVTTTESFGDLFAPTPTYHDPYPSSENACCGDGEAKQAEPYNHFRYEELGLFERTFTTLIKYRRNMDPADAMLLAKAAVEESRNL